jgi:signal transduction histidine kinase
MLDLSKIEAKRMELNLGTFALPPLIDDVDKTIEPLAAKNGNQVVVHCDADQRRVFPLAIRRKAPSPASLDFGCVRMLLSNQSHANSNRVSEVATRKLKIGD